MNRILGGVALSCAVAAMAGCVPVVEPTFPEVDGRVVSGGAPVAGARILAARHGRGICSSVSLATVTAADGSFHVDGSSALVLAPLAGDPQPHWELCVQVGDVIHPGYMPFGFGLVSGVRLTCDIDKPAKHSFEGICR